MKDKTPTETSKVPSAPASKFKGNPNLQAAIAAVNRYPAMSSLSHISSEHDTPDSRDIVRYFLSSLAPVQPYEPPVLSKDLERLNRIVRSIVVAVDEQILTAEEADAVINFIALGFASRRLEEVVGKITMPKSGAWFVLHNNAWEE